MEPSNSSPEHQIVGGNDTTRSEEETFSSTLHTVDRTNVDMTNVDMTNASAIAMSTIVTQAAF